MRRVLEVIAIAALPLGCASMAPVPAPEARSAPQTATLPPSPAPAPPLPPAPQVSPRIDNQEQAVRDVNVRLARAGEIAGQIDPSKLEEVQQEMLSGLKDFISKATEALQARDLPRAQMLADKASRLAEDLALKSPKASR